MSIATAVRPYINEEFLLGHCSAKEQTQRILSLLIEAPRTATELGKIMGFTSRHAHYAFSTMGYLGFVDYVIRGSEKLYLLTEAGETLYGLEGAEWDSYWGAALTTSAPAYLMATEGRDSVIAYMGIRHGVAEENAKVMATVLSSLLRFADAEAIKSHGHPSLHDSQWDSLYISHGSHAVVKPEEKLTFCPTHFISLPATGVCEDCS